MAEERDFRKELEQERDNHRRTGRRVERLVQAVRIAARMDKPTETEVNQLIYLTESGQ